MIKPEIVDAVRALTDEPFGWDGGEDKIVWPESNKTDPPARSAIDAKLAELQAEYDARQYQRDRLAEYPSIQELVVALYDEEDKQALIEKRNAVKAKYPKPE